MKQKIIGIDLDNTIIRYDKIFHSVAVEKKIIPPDIKPVKEEVRNYLRKIGKENLWTKLQGYVYGPGILGADTFEGAMDFLIHCKNNNIKTLIISHKTKKPFLGPKYNLHKYAKGWLRTNGFFNCRTGLKINDVFLELSIGDKIKRISKEKCTHFIDDLPEIFNHSSFPKKTQKILFDPEGKYSKSRNVIYINDWRKALQILK